VDALVSIRTFVATTEAYDNGDFDALAKLYAPDVTWRGIGERASCHGRDDVLEMFRTNMDNGFTLQFQDILAIGQYVVTTVRSPGWPASVTTVFRMNEKGVIVAAEDFSDRREALASIPPRK
jgi:SnoaL-like domain